MADLFEENKVFPQWVGWTFVIVLSAAVVGWGLANYWLVKDVPRHWDFGQLPDVPAQSPYTTAKPTAPGANVPPQIAPLPELQEQPATQETKP